MMFNNTGYNVGSQFLQPRRIPPQPPPTFMSLNHLAYPPHYNGAYNYPQRYPFALQTQQLSNGYSQFQHAQSHNPALVDVGRAAYMNRHQAMRQRVASSSGTADRRNAKDYCSKKPMLPLEWTAILSCKPVLTVAASLQGCDEDQRIQEKTLTIDDFVGEAGVVANKILHNLPAVERRKSEEMFQKWMKEIDKVAVMEMYKNPGWRATYTKRLFRSRMITFGIGLELLTQISDAKHILQNADLGYRSEIKKSFIQAIPYLFVQARTVVSFGCGPGPCIAATILQLRMLMGCVQRLTVTGVDRIPAWEEYIDRLNTFDANTCVRFRCIDISASTVSTLPAGDVAVLSYTDAASHTDDFWRAFRRRHSLILILDQNQGTLQNRLMAAGFLNFDFEFKGVKRFFCSIIQPVGFKTMVDKTAYTSIS